MAKNEKANVKKGNRINGKRASLNSYVQLYEFLLFDPNYREMKDKTKILYSYLRKKAEDWKNITEKYESGEDGFTKSYRDENGEIYLIADNSELSIVLQCHVNRVGGYTKELQEYGLLEIVPRYKQSNLLYVLEPKEEQLNDVWTYIEEIKQKREQVKKENEEKAKKRKEKIKAKKSNSQNVSYTKEEKSNSQNVSYYNSQNVSYYNSQNVRQIYLKGFKSNLNKNKSNINLSIMEEIEKTDLPETIQTTLNQKMDRLIDDSINLSDIKELYEINKDVINEREFNQILNNVLRSDSKIGDIYKYMSTSINNYLNKKPKNKDESNPKEVVPEWFKEQKENKKQAEQEQPEVSKEELDEMLKEHLSKTK